MSPTRFDLRRWGVTLGPLDIEVGGCARRVWRVWVPDGLHVWWGGRGVHIYWSKSRYARRISFDVDKAARS